MGDTSETVGLSIEGYARHRGVTRAAVGQRIKAGSLPTSAKLVGKRWVIDPALADAEWEAHTQPRLSNGTTAGYTPSGLAAATERERNARADSIELDLDRKRRLLVPAAEVELRWSAIAVAVRTKMLGLPSRFKQRAPETLPSALLVLESLIREALEELVSEGEPSS